MDIWSGRYLLTLSFHGNAKSNFDGYSAAKKQSPSNDIQTIPALNASSKITTKVSAIYNYCFTNMHLYYATLNDTIGLHCISQI